MKKLILKDSRKVIGNAVDQFEDFVCSTMGPSGQNIALHNDLGEPVITKDGVSVAKVISFEDPERDIVAQVLKQAAEKTNEEAGDGTTTSTAIASAIFREGQKLLEKGDWNVNAIRKKVEAAQKEVLAELEKVRVKFDEETEEKRKEILYKIAMISTNGDHDLSLLISQAVLKAGLTGVVNTQVAGMSYELTNSTGMKLKNSHPFSMDYFRGLESEKALYKNCRILITTYELESANIINVIQPKVLEPLMKKNESLIIITPKADKGFLANMINNNAKGILKNAIVKAPYFGPVGRKMMEDIAAKCNTVVFDEDKGHKFEALTYDMLGFAKEVEVSEKETIVFEPVPHEERLAERIAMLTAEAKKVDYKTNDIEKAQERLATITGGVYNIKIPRKSDVEDKERVDRIDDAVNACLGALEHGYVPGGGAALVQASREISDKDIAMTMQNVCRYPMKRILSNAGQEDKLSEVMGSVLEVDEVYDVRAESYGKPLETGVIDSYKVIDKAFNNGLSVGLMLLTTKGIIADVPKEGGNFAWDPSMMM